MALPSFWMLAALAVLLAACGSPARSAPNRPEKSIPGHQTGVASPFPVLPVSHQGRWLTDAAGRVLLLHGVNVVEKHPPYYPSAFGFNLADAKWLAANGFDVVRLGVLPTGAMPTPGQISQSYFSHLATTVEQLASYNVLTLLDVHQDGYGPSVGSDGFPAWMTLTAGAVNNHAPFPAYYISNPAVKQAFQSFWDNRTGPGGKGLQQDYAAMIGALAATFARVSSVLGYDVLNEPWPGNTWLPCLSPSGCPSLDRSELAPFYARADHAIRSKDHTHLVFVEPFVLFNFGDSPTTIPLAGNDPLSGLSFHVYPSPFSLSKVSSVISHAVSWSHTTGGALLDTEWGATANPAIITSESSVLDSALIPWIYWPFMGCSVGCSAGSAVGVIGTLSSPPSGANLHTSVTAALVQPHPLAVAGTPRSFAYDAASHIMHFSWSSARAGGGQFPPGTVTSIQVPLLDEPHGYSVRVSGAKVASKQCARMLTLTAISGSTRTASVTITPSDHCA
ncbi:MAG: cellulase family glycosylhydrolase [Acidimicrobiales bacterium]